MKSNQRVHLEILTEGPESLGYQLRLSSLPSGCSRRELSILTGRLSGFQLPNRNKNTLPAGTNNTATILIKNGCSKFKIEKIFDVLPSEHGVLSKRAWDRISLRAERSCRHLSESFLEILVCSRFRKDNKNQKNQTRRLCHEIWTRHFHIDPAVHYWLLARFLNMLTPWNNNSWICHGPLLAPPPILPNHNSEIWLQLWWEFSRARPERVGGSSLAKSHRFRFPNFSVSLLRASFMSLTCFRTFRIQPTQPTQIYFGWVLNRLNGPRFSETTSSARRNSILNNFISLTHFPTSWV